MPRVGDQLQVHASALEGALARAASDGGVEVQVAGLVPGDRARVEVIAVGRSGVFARPLALLSPSPHRVDAPCPIVARCGGCPWQIVRYEEQLRLKREALRALFAPTPLAQVPLAPVESTPGDPPLGFRDKIQMPAGGHAGALTLGFWAPRTHDLVPVARCVVQSALGERVRAAALALFNQHGLAPLAAHPQPMPNGELRSVLLRVGDDAAHVTLVTRSGGRDLGPLAAALAALPEVAGVFQNLNDTTGNRVLGPETRWLAGRTALSRTVAGVAFELSPVGFFQTNVAGASALVRTLHRLLGGLEGRRLLDLYAGTGFLARGLSASGSQPPHIVAAVEADGYAAEVARRQLPDARVLHEDVAARSWRTESVDAVVADPPRKGMPPEVIEALAETGAQRLLYVACAPESVARDAPLLVAQGWVPTKAVPVDMFPHTPHVEVVVRFDRRSSASAQRPPDGARGTARD